MLDFLDLAKKIWFPDQKRYSTPPEFPDGNELRLSSDPFSNIKTARPRQEFCQSRAGLDAVFGKLCLEKSDGRSRGFLKVDRHSAVTCDVPGLCGVNLDSFMARKLLGQPPLTLGISPEFTAKLLKLAPFDVVPSLTNSHIANEPYDDARVLLLPP